MMNLKHACITAAVALAYCSTAAAQSTSVAYVDIDRVTEKSEKINTAMASVKGRVEDIQKEIEEKRKRLVEIRAEIKKGEGVLAESEMKKKRNQTAGLDKELVDLEYEGRRELQKLDTTLFEPMIKTIVLAIQDVAREKKIDLVVRGEAVIYGADSADITDDVIKKLNSSAYMTNAASGGDSESTGSGPGDDESTGSSKEVESKVKPGPSPSSDSAASSQKKAAANPVAEKTIIPMARRPVDRQQD